MLTASIIGHHPEK